MTRRIQVQILLIAIFVGTYLLRTPGLVDEFYIGRFAWLSFLGLIAVAFIFRKKDPFRINLLDLAFAGFYLMALISLSWADLPSAGFVNVQTILIALVFYLFFRVYGSVLADAHIWQIIIVLSIIVCCLATYDILEVGLKGGLSGKKMYLLTAYSGHKNLLASFLFLLFGFNLYWVYSRPKNNWIFFLLLWQFVIILLLRSRSVYLALATIVALTGIHTFYGKYQDRKFATLRIASIVLTGLALSIGLFFSFGGKLSDIRALNPSKYSTSVSGKERQFIWYKSGQLIADRPWVGYGAGNWKLHFPSKNIKGADRLQSKNVIVNRVHNDFIEVWAEYGVFGLCLFLSLFALALFGTVFSLNKSPPVDAGKLMVLAGTLIGYGLISFFDFPKERLEHQVLFAFLLSLAAQQSNYLFSQPRISFTLNHRMMKQLSMLIFAMVLLNIPLSYLQIKGEVHTLAALQAKNAKLWNLMEQESNQAYSIAYQITPLVTSLKWLEGLAQYQQGRFVEADQSFVEATEHTPYFIRLLNDHGSCLVQLGEVTKGTKLIEQALAINPQFEDAIFNLAYLSTLKHDFNQARILLQKIKKDLTKKDAFLKEISILEQNKGQL